MKENRVIISKNIKDTEKIAREFMEKITSPQIPSPEYLRGENINATIVGLYGDLGVGKTAFTQIVGKMLGVKKKINSPTFVIMKRYTLRGVGHPQKRCPTPLFKNLFHLDAYRLKNEKELLQLGWAEIIKNPENIIFIEWPEKVIKAMPKKHNKIQITHTKEGHRKFNIKYS